MKCSAKCDSPSLKRKASKGIPTVDQTNELLDLEDLPTSYTLSQRLMLVAFAASLSYRKVAVLQIPDFARSILLCSIAAIVLLSVLLTSYVVVRYPYLALVRTRKADVFFSIFTSRFLRGVMKAVGLSILSLLTLGLTHAVLNEGLNDLRAVILLAYVAVVFAFVFYLSFIHNPRTHPTVATFVRSSLGIGVLLVPVLLPALIVGSMRCRRLLNPSSDA